ncbi:hypothetical protein BLNAU_20674 [Blattamonas nauphoetae]|uniref:Uncharacterized protein n=1 Tax=Blattamonas nauphoetae TaxID=2049346 RepID=A0ABQ9WY26_9EUKA|nr:hypothetical protein BLNAU_20674 [Blattamonas nauphoetae]
MPQKDKPQKSGYTTKQSGDGCGMAGMWGASHFDEINVMCCCDGLKVNTAKGKVIPMYRAVMQGIVSRDFRQ